MRFSSTLSSGYDIYSRSGSVMSLEEKIIQYIQELPEAKRAEVLDFVEYLRNKAEEKDWSDFSLSSAMRGMENEIEHYSLQDIKESFK
jgi:hypothetical protein